MLLYCNINVYNNVENCPPLKEIEGLNRITAQLVQNLNEAIAIRMGGRQLSWQPVSKAVKLDDRYPETFKHLYVEKLS